MYSSRLYASDLRPTFVLCCVGHDPQKVCEESLSSMISRVGGSGGVIAINTAGEVALHHTTPAMAWAYVAAGDSRVHHGLFQGEHLTETL